jgi:hypothetical protein
LGDITVSASIGMGRGVHRLMVLLLMGLGRRWWAPIVVVVVMVAAGLVGRFHVVFATILLDGLVFIVAGYGSSMVGVVVSVAGRSL